MTEEHNLQAISGGGHTITHLPCGWAVAAPDGRIVSRHHPTREVAETACRIFNGEEAE